MKPVRPLLALAAALAAAVPSIAHAESALATPKQLDAEDAAIELLTDPAVVTARESALTLFEANPTAATPDGKATVVQAVDEFVYNAALTAVGGPEAPRGSGAPSTSRIGSPEAPPGWGAAKHLPDGEPRSASRMGSSRGAPAPLDHDQSCANEGT